MSIYDVIAGAESSFGRNVNGPVTSSGQAQGAYQITTGTWSDFAAKAGISTVQYPTPNSAPLDVQTQVADQIPLNRWAPSTVAAVQQQYPGVDTSQTVGQLAQQTAGSHASYFGGYDSQGNFLGGTTDPLNYPITGATKYQQQTSDTTGSQSSGTNTGAGTGSGMPISVGLQSGFSAWLGNVSDWIAAGFRSGFGILSNWFIRAMLILVGIAVLVVALFRLMDPDNSTIKVIAKGAMAA